MTVAQLMALYDVEHERDKPQLQTGTIADLIALKQMRMVAANG